VLTAELLAMGIKVNEGSDTMDEGKSGPKASGSLERVRESFRKQGLMRLLDARVVEAGKGRCVIEVPFRDELTQQERYFHGTVTGAIADTAGATLPSHSLRPTARCSQSSTRSISWRRRGARSSLPAGRS
jgi:hypothetical protein